MTGYFVVFIVLPIGNTRELLEYLNRSAELLAENHDILDNVLETLDLEQHTIPILYILEAKLTYFMVRRVAVAVFF